MTSENKHIEPTNLSTPYMQRTSTSNWRVTLNAEISNYMHITSCANMDRSTREIKINKLAEFSTFKKTPPHPTALYSNKWRQSSLSKNI